MGIIFTQIASAAKKSTSWFMCLVWVLAGALRSSRFRDKQLRVSKPWLIWANTKEGSTCKPVRCPLWTSHVPSLFCWCPCGGKHLITRKETQQSLLENTPSRWEVSTYYCSPTRHCDFSFFNSKSILVHVRSLLIVRQHTVTSKSQLKVLFAKLCHPPLTLFAILLLAPCGATSKS